MHQSPTTAAHSPGREPALCRRRHLRATLGRGSPRAGLWWLVAVAVALVVGVLPALPAAATSVFPPGATGSLTMTSDPGDYIGQGASYSYTLPADASTFTFQYLNQAPPDVQVFFITPAFEFWDLIFAGPGDEPLHVGEYADAIRGGDATHPGLDVGGDGRGCNGLSGSFTVNELSRAGDGSLLLFDATFEQHCERAAPALRGHVHAMAPGALAVTTGSLPPARLGVPYAASLSASGGTAPYHWSVLQGLLPVGIALSPAGTLSGTPLVVGTTTVLVQVTDSTTPPQVATQEVTITVGGCDETVTGARAGPLTIKAGVTCIDQAVIGGPIIVFPQASVAIAASRVAGPVISVGAGVVSVCGSQVVGAIAIARSTGPVLIGDGGDDGQPGCGPDAVLGSVYLVDNAGGVELSGDVVTGSLGLVGTTGVGGPDGAGSVLEANRFGGAVVCAANSPAPTDQGRHNLAAGHGYGQCAALA